MAQNINLPATTYAPGNYEFDIQAPNRKNSATLTLTRLGIAPATDWPDGDCFTYEVLEQERGGTLQPLTSGTEAGGRVIGRDGTINPPLTIRVSWKPDKDKDRILIRITVLQPVRTAIALGFN